MINKTAEEEGHWHVTVDDPFLGISQRIHCFGSDVSFALQWMREPVAAWYGRRVWDWEETQILGHDDFTSAMEVVLDTWPSPDLIGNFYEVRFVGYGTACLEWVMGPREGEYGEEMPCVWEKKMSP